MKVETLLYTTTKNVDFRFVISPELITDEEKDYFIDLFKSFYRDKELIKNIKKYNQYPIKFIERGQYIYLCRFIKINYLDYTGRDIFALEALCCSRDKTIFFWSILPELLSKYDKYSVLSMFDFEEADAFFEKKLDANISIDEIIENRNKEDNLPNVEFQNFLNKMSYSRVILKEFDYLPKFKKEVEDKEPLYKNVEFKQKLDLYEKYSENNSSSKEYSNKNNIKHFLKNNYEMEECIISILENKTKNSERSLVQIFLETNNKRIIIFEDSCNSKDFKYYSQALLNQEIEKLIKSGWKISNTKNGLTTLERMKKNNFFFKGLTSFFWGKTII